MKDEITSNVVNVLWRIVFFIIYYIFLICCGIALIWLALTITGWAIFDVLPSLHSINIRGLIIALCAFLVMWGVVGLFALYLIKPLFAFTKNENTDRVEIFPKDAALLFQCIEELAKETGCKQPKHVYLTTDVNACVFYNTNFWSIFLPIRKNLEIGLGLFQATSKDEVKSVIGHEFGHFAQGSMKIGSTVYVVNSILHNLVFAKDFFEEWVDDLCKSDTSVWIRAWGGLVRWLTNIVKRLNILVYKLVQRSYMKLSRQMEYDADNVSCKNVGKEAFVSALCKIEITAQFQNIYEQFIQHLVSQGKTIQDYWMGYDVVKDIIGTEYAYTFNEHSVLNTPVYIGKHVSRVLIDNVWDSHPSLSKRIENASKSTVHTQRDETAAWSLIPDDLKNKIGTYRLSQYAETYKGKLEDLSSADFRTWIENEVETYFIPLSLKPFFDRNIILFENADSDITECPLSDSNAEVLSEYETALHDWELLNAIQDKQIETDTFTYCGKVCTRKSVPIAVHKAYLMELHDKAKQIDHDVYLFLRQHCEEPDRISYAFHCVFTANHMLPAFNRAAEYRTAMVDNWNSFGGRDEADFNNLLSNVNGLLNSVKQFVREYVDWDLLKSVVEDNLLEEMKTFISDGDIQAYQGAGKVNEAFGTIDKFGNAYQYMARLGKHIIIQEAKKIAAGCSCNVIHSD